MVTLVYLSLLLAVTGIIGAVCYGRNIPKSISALVYQGSLTSGPKRVPPVRSAAALD